MWKSKCTKLEQKLDLSGRLNISLSEEIERKDAQSSKAALETAKLRDKIIQIQLKHERMHIENIVTNNHTQLDRRCRELIKKKQTLRTLMKDNEQKKRIYEQEKRVEEKLSFLENNLLDKIQKMKHSFTFEQKWYVDHLKVKDNEKRNLLLTIEHLRETIEDLEGIC
eukprot:c25238_g1_i1.p1 GENE.c25238_g1_i1~~c25238_g1_i1.p1  ORF type:complete len:182 (-),score=73.63 c25238_g1_i1:18-518(-)